MWRGEESQEKETRTKILTKKQSPQNAFLNL